MPQFVQSVDVTAEHVREYALATGESDPIYYDVAVAARAGYRAIPAPPTFTHALALSAVPKLDLFAELGIDPQHALHAGQSFSYGAPILVGDRIVLRTSIKEKIEKKAGALTLYRFETTATNGAGELCVLMGSTVAVRSTRTA